LIIFRFFIFLHINFFFILIYILFFYFIIIYIIIYIYLLFFLFIKKLWINLIYSHLLLLTRYNLLLLLTTHLKRCYRISALCNVLEAYHKSKALVKAFESCNKSANKSLLLPIEMNPMTQNGRW